MEMIEQARAEVRGEQRREQIEVGAEVRAVIKM
jgi:hypothetical protein